VEASAAPDRRRYASNYMNDKNHIDICECDVEDKESLALFRLKRSEWKRCLIDDNYSVSRQISHLLWNDAVFRSFNEARKLSIEKKDAKLGLNGPLVNLLDEGFVAMQIMAIRRLTDPNFYDPKKAVISLLRVINDIGDHLNLFTRENYICLDGTAYEGLSHDKDGIDWLHWDRKHKNFDRLSGTSKKKRSRNDQLDKKIISFLRSELNACADLRTYANKFIAHTSDNPGKIKLTDRQKSVTLDKLDGAYKSIIRTGSFLGAIILYEHTLGGIPVPQYDQFKNLDKPTIMREDLSTLYTYWNNREKEVGSWDQELWPKFKA
jgi:hypothetical protein